MAGVIAGIILGLAGIFIAGVIFVLGLIAGSTSCSLRKLGIMDDGVEE